MLHLKGLWTNPLTNPLCELLEMLESQTVQPQVIKVEYCCMLLQMYFAANHMWYCESNRIQGSRSTPNVRKPCLLVVAIDGQSSTTADLAFDVCERDFMCFKIEVERFYSLVLTFFKAQLKTYFFKQHLLDVYFY